jgi:hypothetical protein
MNMRTKFIIDQARIFFVMLGIIIVSLLQSAAHEVTPNIADISINGKSITVELRFNVEAFLARLDLSTIDNTDEAEQISDYQTLRELTAEDLTGVFEDNWLTFSNQVNLQINGLDEPNALDFLNLSIPDIEDFELPRLSRVSFRVNVPDKGGVTFKLNETFGSTILRQMGVEQGLTQYLAPGQTSDPMQQDVSLRKSAISRLGEYIPIGFDHVVPRGLDHILFVFGLFLLSLKTSVLLWQISAFTLAHTLTLIAGAFGVINISASIVEPLIAASIVFVAVENIFFSKLNKWRTALIFGFGLLHGLGFASVLAGFSLPTEQFIPALIGFNIGVELGQLSVIAIAYFIIGLTFGKKPYYRSLITIPASCIIAVIGSWWVFERILLS